MANKCILLGCAPEDDTNELDVNHAKRNEYCDSH